MPWGEIAFFAGGFLTGFGTRYFFDRRKELRSRIEQVISIVDEIEVLSIQYWSVPHDVTNDGLTETLIKSKFKKVNSELLQIEVYYCSFKMRSSSFLHGNYRPILELKNKVTSGDFESPNRQADLERIEDISSLAQRLCIEIRNCQKFLI